VKPFREEMVKNFKVLTLLVMGAVLFVHLIACANVANLLLARGSARPSPAVKSYRTAFASMSSGSARSAVPSRPAGR
jgi:hypothetical protein